MKKKVYVLCAVILAILAAVVFLKKDEIFQRGNPIPYLNAVVQLSETNPYVAVDEENRIYISKRGDKEALFQMIQDTYGVEFIDQLGSGYLFSDGEKSYIVSSEIYWGRFTVWTLPSRHKDHYYSNEN
ncbi:MAG: hypothetical protein IJ307_02555 [Bacteroidales bacterium]|nr:hypothetical protein [Bacteroidales bacterium]